MSYLIQIVLCLSALSFPIVFFRFYLTSLEKKAKKIIGEHSDSSSEVFTDLKVWFKNFDAFKKKSKLDFDPYETLYSYNTCDLIVNEGNFVVIGKTKIFGKEKSLTPTIFEFNENELPQTPRHVRIENIHDIGNDLEIEFTDTKYEDRITLVLKRVKADLKEKIKTCYNNR